MTVENEAARISYLRRTFISPAPILEKEEWDLFSPDSRKVLLPQVVEATRYNCIVPIEGHRRTGRTSILRNALRERGETNPNLLPVYYDTMAEYFNLLPVYYDTIAEYFGELYGYPNVEPTMEAIFYSLAGAIVFNHEIEGEYQNNTRLDFLGTFYEKMKNDYPHDRMTFEQLRDFIREALQYIGKEELLLGIDDLDFLSGYPQLMKMIPDYPQLMKRIRELTEEKNLRVLYTAQIKSRTPRESSEQAFRVNDFSRSEAEKLAKLAGFAFKDERTRDLFWLLQRGQPAVLQNTLGYWDQYETGIDTLPWDTGREDSYIKKQYDQDGRLVINPLLIRAAHRKQSWFTTRSMPLDFIPHCQYEDGTLVYPELSALYRAPGDVYGEPIDSQIKENMDYYVYFRDNSQDREGRSYINSKAQSKYRGYWSNE